MGCDIHGVLQHKEKGQWVDKEILDIDRNYSLFGVLAGVRGFYEVPIDEPRGLPKDFHVVERPEYTGTKYRPSAIYESEYGDPGIFMGDHSFTYLTLEEIQKYKHWHRIDYVQQEFKDLFFRCRDLSKWRLVLGFDS